MPVLERPAERAPQPEAPAAQSAPEAASRTPRRRPPNPYENALARAALLIALAVIAGVWWVGGYSTIAWLSSAGVPVVAERVGDVADRQRGDVRAEGLVEPQRRAGDEPQHQAHHDRADDERDELGSHGRLDDGVGGVVDLGFVGRSHATGAGAAGLALGDAHVERDRVDRRDRRGPLPPPRTRRGLLRRARGLRPRQWPRARDPAAGDGEGAEEAGSPR